MINKHVLATLGGKKRRLGLALGPISSQVDRGQAASRSSLRSGEEDSRVWLLAGGWVVELSVPRLKSKPKTSSTYD